MIQLIYACGVGSSESGSTPGDCLHECSKGIQRFIEAFWELSSRGSGIVLIRVQTRVPRALVESIESSQFFKFYKLALAAVGTVGEKQ